MSDETDQGLLEVPYVQWMGDPVDAMPPASAILAEHVGALSGINDALAFYAGEQWPPKVRAEREHEPPERRVRIGGGGHGAAPTATAPPRRHNIHGRAP